MPQPNSKQQTANSKQADKQTSKSANKHEKRVTKDSSRTDSSSNNPHRPKSTSNSNIDAGSSKLPTSRATGTERHTERHGRPKSNQPKQLGASAAGKGQPSERSDLTVKCHECKRIDWYLKAGDTQARCGSCGHTQCFKCGSKEFC